MKFRRCTPFPTVMNNSKPTPKHDGSTNKKSGSAIKVRSGVKAGGGPGHFVVGH